MFINLTINTIVVYDDGIVITTVYAETFEARKFRETRKKAIFALLISRNPKECKDFTILISRNSHS